METLKDAKVIEDDESDEDWEGELAADKLKRLYERKDDLLANLHAIDVSLGKLGYNVVSKKVQAAKKTALTGIRIDNKLSFRGKDSAIEYFRRLDEDNDGYIEWEDFRAMRSLGADFMPEVGGLVHDPELMTWESWKMNVCDMGLVIDDLGRVDFQNFIKYREQVELQKPLARELQVLNIPLLPADLLLWGHIKEVLVEVVEELSPARRGDIDTKGLMFDEIQYLLCNIGITYTRPEFFQNMAYRAMQENLMESLRRKYLKSQYPGTTSKYEDPLAAGVISQRAIVLSIEHIKYTKIPQLMAWLFGNRPQPKKVIGLYHRLLNWKYAVHRKLRYLDKLSKTVFSIGYQLRLRRVFEDFKSIQNLKPQQAVKTALNFVAEITGSGGNLDTGLGFEWGAQKVEHPEAFLMNHKLPRECGFAVIFEIMLKPDVDREVAEDAAHHFLTFLKLHFDGELKKNVQFRGIFCFEAMSEGDGAHVMRIAITYKRIVSLDSWMEQLLIPYCLNDLIVGFSGSLKTNIALSDIFNSQATFQLDTLTTARFETSLQYRAYPILELLKRVKLALAAGYTDHQTRSGSEDMNELLRRKLRVYYPYIVSSCEYLESIIRGQKGLNFIFVFKKLSNMLSKIGGASHWFSQNFPPSIGSIPGFITSAFSELSKNFLSEYAEIFNPIRDRMENKVKVEELEQKRSQQMLRTAKSGSKEKSEKETQVNKAESVMDKLKMLGIEMDEDDVMAEDAHDPASLIQTAHERLVKNDTASCIAFEKFHDVCLGLHSVQILVGKFKINASVQGFDFMEAIPKPPSLQKVKKDCEDKRKDLKEQSDAKYKEERRKKMKEREDEERRARKDKKRKEREQAEKD